MTHLPDNGGGSLDMLGHGIQGRIEVRKNLIGRALFLRSLDYDLLTPKEVCDVEREIVGLLFDLILDTTADPRILGG